MSFEFLSVLGAAVALKLITSADDVIWLAKLFQSVHGWRLGILHIVYITTLSFVCVLSFVLAELGTESFFALTGKEEWFSFIASILLIIFAVTILRNENDDDPDTDENKLLFTRIRDAFVISFIGSLDELAVYIVGLSTGEINFSALLLGTIIGSVLTLLIVHGIRYIRGIVVMLEKIPIWVIIALLGVAGLVYSIWDLYT